MRKHSDPEYRLYTSRELLNRFHPSLRAALTDAAQTSLKEQQPIYVGLIVRSRAAAVKAMGRRGEKIWDSQFDPVRPREVGFFNTWRVEVKELGPE